jgi:hypothetical protein
MPAPRFMSILTALLSASTAGATLSAAQQKSMDNMVGMLPMGNGKTRRSKVKPDRAPRRRNMNHVSRRTKRKHRRAA